MTSLNEQLRAEAERYGLGSSEIDALRIFVECVRGAESSRVKNKWKEAAPKRLAKSLQALELEQVRHATEMADIGSGAGFPGLVLAAALPRVRMTLIEQNGRRCEFLRTTAQAMDLTNVEVVQTPVQVWQEGAGRFDIVTSRGVMEVQVMIRLAAPLLQLGGALIVWMKETRARSQNSEADADSIARSVGLVPSGQYVPESGMGIFAYTRADEAPVSATTPAAVSHGPAPAPLVRKRGKLERKIEEAEVAVAQIDAQIVDARERRTHAGEKEAASLAVEIARLELVRAALVERLKIKSSWMRAPETDPAHRSAGARRD
jgi:16S rRNA (guanine527-N7)-methyltransferase